MTIMSNKPVVYPDGFVPLRRAIMFCAKCKKEWEGVSVGDNVAGGMTCPLCRGGPHRSTPGAGPYLKFREDLMPEHAMAVWEEERESELVGVTGLLGFSSFAGYTGNFGRANPEGTLMIWEECLA